MPEIGSCIKQPLLVKQVPRVQINSMKNDVVSLFISKCKDDPCAMSLNTLYYFTLQRSISSYKCNKSSTAFHWWRIDWILFAENYVSLLTVNHQHFVFRTGRIASCSRGVIKWKHFPRYWTLCARNSPVTVEFPSQRPIMRSFDGFFDLRLNKWLSKQSWGWCSETPSRPLWHHGNVKLYTCIYGNELPPGLSSKLF